MSILATKPTRNIGARRLTTGIATGAILLLALIGPGCSSDDGGDDGGGNGSPSPLDPAPGKNDPGEYRCETCPDSDVSEFEQNVGQNTSLTLGGTVTGATGDGTFYVVNATGREIRGTIDTDGETGAFDFTVPVFCGSQLVKCVWSNEAGQYVLVVQVIREDCTEPDIRVTLVWDDLGRDFELHLIREGGHINDSVEDCTWTTCISSHPDWGVQGDPSDDPQKDVDDTGAFGPENIFLAKPEAMTYTVMVEHWSFSGSPDADGTVYFNLAGKTVTAKIQDLAPGCVWTAGTIEWPSGTVHTSTDVYNCTDEWEGGCTAEIP